MKLLFCKLGLHWRMKIGEYLFTDIVSGKGVHDAVCPCGKHWMVDVTHGFPIFKVPRNRYESRLELDNNLPDPDNEIK